MRTERITFKNQQGLELSARLEMPPGGRTNQFGIFAHCFTCGKNARAATTISRQLTQSGFGILRFDFTGLGMSEGEFAHTDFTSNLEDLTAAADFLKENYEAPSLLIGHSLGGTAVLHAARMIDSVKAVCTIGAPFEASHVLKLLESSREEIMKYGKAAANIGGRKFIIGADFIRDIEVHSTAGLLPDLKKPLLVMHSPQDQVVEIENAAEIYGAAFHPKSFISLDGADHLLTKSEDSTYAANVLAAWVRRYITVEENPSFETDKEVAVQLGSDKFTTEVITGKHSFLADEPESAGGNNFGPSPYQLLSAALGTCTAMTLRMYADRKDWPLECVTVHLSFEKQHVQDSSDPDSAKSKLGVFSREIVLEGDLDEKQREKLLEIANKCPVHRTLTDSDIKIETKLRKSDD